MSDDEPTRVQRFEVFTGAGRRRAWRPAEKAAIVAESLADGETVCGVARRHGLTPQQLFTWRRQARVMTNDDGLTEGPAFLPAVVAEAEPPVLEGAEPVHRRGRQRGRREPGLIEVEIGGATVRVGRGAETKVVTAILLALKAQP